ncbi:MAG: aminopeptidase P family protein, partial [Deltaproteobacteria bacterium]|nr:aminopeptidase P family protein [Deltaproteobacteria bacterium]
CVVTSRRAMLVTDGRYKEQVRAETKGFTVRIARDSLLEELPKSSVLSDSTRIAIEHAVLPVAGLTRLKKLFPRKKFIPSAGIVEMLASVKDETEIGHLLAAASITDAVFREMLEVMREGMTEADVAAEISYRQRHRGAEGDAFEAIVAAGDHAALPHARASNRPLKNGDLVVLDFGCCVEGYHSDLTRTVAIGKPSSDLRKVYAVVHEAQARALERCIVPVSAKALDGVARAHIRRAGFGKYFPHSLGHGLGLQIHEEPKVSARSSATLVAGMVVTIEPGVYVPGLGGVRIEDDVVLRANGPEILTKAPKELIIL